MIFFSHNLARVFLLPKIGKNFMEINTARTNSAMKESPASELSSLNPRLEVKSKIWSIGGGKGGVGKSMVTANTAIMLAQMGYKVVAVDLDLGGANLHTCLGMGIPQKTLSDYISRQVSSLKEVVVPSPIENLSIISGAQDEIGIANLKYLQKNKLLKNLNDLNADYILLDLGAGTSFNTLDFFITAHKGLLVVLPEPTSIENTYRFIKSIFIRKIKMIDDFLEIQPLINKAMTAKIGTRQSVPSEMIANVCQINPQLGQRLKDEISQLKFQIIMNQVRNKSEAEMGYSIQTICKKYFGVQVEYLGYLDYDQSAWQSVKKRRPVTQEFPHCNLSMSFKKLVAKLYSQ